MPGFATELQSHAADSRDMNPNRTRDNLDLLKFSLRSVERHAPWLGRVFILTCRPQVPAWLDTAHPDVTVVHHDEIMDRRHLPTFNSFAIISHLHLIDGLSDRFLYMEDDMLFLRDTRREQFVDPGGRLMVYEHRSRTPVLADLDAATSSPWNLALAECNRLLDERYGTVPRRHVNHVPLLIDRNAWGEMLSLWEDHTEATRSSKFRAAGNIAPEYLYPHWRAAEDRAVILKGAETRRFAGYVPLENLWALTAFNLMRIRLFKPYCCTFNDNFEQRPNPRVEHLVRQKLERLFPVPGRFEKPAGGAS